jgi:hypothetical protein
MNDKTSGNVREKIKSSRSELPVENLGRALRISPNDWLTVLDNTPITPAYYRHSTFGYDPKIPLSTLKEITKHDLSGADQAFLDFKKNTATITNEEDKKLADGEAELLIQLYQEWCAGEKRYVREQDVLTAIVNIKNRYDGQYKDEGSKQQRAKAYEQLQTDLEQRLDHANLAQPYLLRNTKLANTSLSEISPGSIVESSGFALSKSELLAQGNGNFKIKSSVFTTMSTRLAKVERSIALIAAQQTNKETGQVTGAFTFSTETKKVAEKAYIYARLQGFEAHQITINYQNQPFTHNHKQLEKEVTKLRGKLDEKIEQALDPHYVKEPSTDSNRKSVAFKSSLPNIEEKQEPGIRELEVIFPANESPLGKALEMANTGNMTTLHGKTGNMTTLHGKTGNMTTLHGKTGNITTLTAETTDSPGPQQPGMG